MQEAGSKRPLGITAISVLLLALGAELTGMAIVNLASDMGFLATTEGAMLRYLMFAYVFAGLTSAGFGVALYEGLHWARSASLFVLAFFSTMRLFRMASEPLSQMAFGAGLCAVCIGAIVYLCLPEAKEFMSVSLKKTWEAPVRVEPAGALQRAL